MKKMSDAERKTAHRAATKKFRESHPNYDNERYHKIKETLRVKQKELRDRPERKAYHKEWCNNNRDKVNENQKRHRATSDNYREKTNIAHKKWREENRERHLETRKRQYQERHKTITYRLNGSMRGMMWYSLHGRKNLSWKKCVDYTMDDLKCHLEKHFKSGMTWENYGRGGWEIDHQIPIAVHNIASPMDYDFKRCWSLSNLRPLWGKENQAKKDRLYEPFQPSLL